MRITPERQALLDRVYAAEAKAVETEQRICFGLAWFATEDEANELSEANIAADITVNGGWYSGMHCKRAREFDYEKDGRKLYACRT